MDDSRTSLLEDSMTALPHPGAPCSVNGEASPRGPLLLAEARHCWEAWGEFRERRERCKRYTYGRQWDDMIEVDGQMMREEDFISREGHLPLKNNLIRRMVRSVVGTWLNTRESLTASTLSQTTPSPSTSETDSLDALDKRLRLSHERNSILELTMRAMEEFLISGLTVWRKSFSTEGDHPDIRTSTVSPANFFIDTDSADVRGLDADIVGELHDVSFGRLCAAMARTPADYRRLAAIYSPENVEGGKGNFLHPSRSGLCRVVEVWRRERRERYRCHDPKEATVFRIEAQDYASVVADENRRRLAKGRDAGLADSDIPLIRARWMIDETWRYYFLSPQGDILAEGDTPYSHGGHPYVFKAYPFLDGEIHSFVADVIDQQRHINRLITIFDWVMRASAKGVLLFPEEAMPRGWTLRDVANEWTRHNGVIMIKTKEGAPLPQQVSSNSVNIGIVELLNIQMQMLEDISGVNGALQGKLSNNNVSGTLYDSQTRNALTSLLDILESFKAFERRAHEMDLSLLRQFDNEEISQTGKDKDGIHEYPPNFASGN